MLLKAAGTRPEPAVSMPSEKLDKTGRDGDRRPRARSARDEFLGFEAIPARAVGRAVPTSPVAN